MDRCVRVYVNVSSRRQRRLRENERRVGLGVWGGEVNRAAKDERGSAGDGGDARRSRGETSA